MSRLIVTGPLPPPFHGVSVSTSLVLASPLLRERFEVEHLDTSDHRAGVNLGQWDARNVLLGLRQALTLARKLRGERGTVYLPISQGTGGFLRDSLFIHLAALRGWKVAAHLRGSEFRDFYLASPAPLRAWMRVTLRRLTSVAVMGSALGKVFDGLVDPSRVAVVPNGTPDLSPNGEHRGENVLFLSNLRRRKGVVEALEAALLVLERRPSARFLFVGAWEDAELRHDLVERARAAGDGIRFAPPTVGDAKDALLRSSAVLLFPPREPEGHPRVVLEALSAGVPVVTTDRGAIAETVGDDAGFVEPEPVPGKLAAHVLALLENDELRMRMGGAARARYLAGYTQEHADRRLVAWLETVAEGDG